MQRFRLILMTVAVLMLMMAALPGIAQASQLKPKCRHATPVHLIRCSDRLGEPGGKEAVGHIKPKCKNAAKPAHIFRCSERHDTGAAG
jgi:transcriptional regulator of nitric oxide reductase